VNLLSQPDFCLAPSCLQGRDLLATDVEIRGHSRRWALGICSVYPSGKSMLVRLATVKHVYGTDFAGQLEPL